VDFHLTAEQQRLQHKCRELAVDFASRSATHDRDASHPIENYERLREEGFLALGVGKEWGGAGASFLDHTIAYEVLGQGCPSTALAFNMHASVVMPLLQSAEVSAEPKRQIAELVVQQRKLIAGNFSEPVTTSLIGERPLKARARQVDGGYRVTGRKMFASMLEAADFVLVMAYPDGATNPSAGIILMLPRVAEGRSVDPNWGVLGMRATRSDSLVLDGCWLPESAAIFRSDDMRPFRHAYLNWFWGSYITPQSISASRKPRSTRAPGRECAPAGRLCPAARLPPDVRRHVAVMSADLEAARLITYRSAWLSDKEVPTAETTAALYRAKYMVSEAVSTITRTAVTLGGVHGIFKTSRLEQLFRDGALGPLHPPPAVSASTTWVCTSWGLTLPTCCRR
jgi:alkylation response protein AidB-like acyl-CoA dehydrogenase